MDRRPTKMDHRRIVKKIIESKLEEGRIRGRPRLRWLENVERDIWEMNVKRWRHKAVHTEELVSVIEAKALKRAVQPRTK